MELQRYLQERKELIDRMLDTYLPKENEQPAILHKAIRYSLFANGKRIRPILHLAAGEAVGGAPEPLLPFACALELIHTYSLIHDDLPAIDNDDFRRGRPSSHKAFGEAVAILAGDALLTEAFALMSRNASSTSLQPASVLRAISEIAEASGSKGMVGGQTVDIQSEGKQVDSETLHYIHTHKTGALIVASIRSAVILSGGSDSQLEALTRYASNIGLAFQIMDDILNVEGDRSELGKRVGTDSERGKATYPSVFSLEEAKAKMKALVDEAISEIGTFDKKSDPLRQIAEYIIARKR